MVKQIIDILVLDEFKGVSERVDIAKGKYKFPFTYRELKNTIKRIFKSKK